MQRKIKKSPSRLLGYFSSCLILFVGCNSNTPEKEDSGIADSALDGSDYDSSASDADGDSDTDSGADAGIDAGDAGGDAHIDPCADASPPDCVRYANVNAEEDSDGLSWNTATRDIQTAINSAFDQTREDGGPSMCEVWVAKGDYYIYLNGPSDTIQLKPGVEVYGGFSGDEGLRCKRDWVSNQSVINGYDYDRDGGSVNSNGVYHVVTGSDKSVIDGFIILGGNSSDDDISHGGGFLDHFTSSTISHILFHKNHGHGIAIYGGSSTIVSSEFGPESGGIYIEGGSVEITSSVFFLNFGKDGSSVYCPSGRVDISASTFIGNFATESGGAIFGNGNLSISNSVFAYNEAIENGGAIDWSGEVEIVNSVFLGNWVQHEGPQDPMPGGGIAGGEGNIYNTIFWNNEPYDLWIDPFVDEGYTTYNTDMCWGYAGSYSDKDDTCFCEDPLFVDEGEMGWYEIIEEPDLHLKADSPCIDKADDDKAPDKDIEGKKRVDIPGVGNPGTKADVGAYEYRP